MIGGAFAGFVNALLFAIYDRFPIAPNSKKGNQLEAVDRPRLAPYNARFAAIKHYEDVTSSYCGPGAR
jgi:hypothetical protein